MTFFHSTATSPFRSLRSKEMSEAPQLQDLRASHPSTLSLLEHAPFEIGGLVDGSFVRMLLPEEHYSLGEWVAVQDDSSKFRLSYIVHADENGLAMSDWGHGGLPLPVHPRFIFKLQESIMRAIMLNKIAHHQLSLFTPKRDLIAESRHVELGDTIAPEMVRPLCEMSEVVLGKMVAVQPRYPEPWYLTRVVGFDKRKNEILYLDPHSNNVEGRTVECFRKLIAYPTPIAPSPVPVCVSPLSGLELHRPPVTVEELIRRWGHGREFGECISGSPECPPRYGYRMQEADRRFVEQIIEAHNARFCGTDAQVTSLQNATGKILERLWPQGTTLYVQADTHGDAASLVSLFIELQRQGKLDAHFRCVSTFKCCFLGDYMDRGINNFEALGLLLLFRMENPDSVFLMKGNHECVLINEAYLHGADSEFLHQHQKALTAAYNSFPVLLMAAAEEGVAKEPGVRQRQYLHLAHASFSPALNFSRVLKGENSEILLGRELHFAPHMKATTEKTRLAAAALLARYGSEPRALDPAGVMWSDIDDDEGPSPSQRGLGYVFTSDDIATYFRAASCLEAKVCAADFGHAHHFSQYRHPDNGRVLATILPVCPATGFFSQELPREQIQGVMYTLAPHMKDWKKVPMIVRMDEETHLPIFGMSMEERRMYEPFDSLEEDPTIPGEGVAGQPEGEAPVSLPDASREEHDVPTGVVGDMPASIAAEEGAMSSVRAESQANGSPLFTAEMLGCVDPLEKDVREEDE